MSLDLATGPIGICLPAAPPRTDVGARFSEKNPVHMYSMIPMDAVNSKAPECCANELKGGVEISRGKKHKVTAEAGVD